MMRSFKCPDGCLTRLTLRTALILLSLSAAGCGDKRCDTACGLTITGMFVTLPVWGPPLLVVGKLNDAVRHVVSIGPVPKVTFTAPGLDVETTSVALPSPQSREPGPLVVMPDGVGAFLVFRQVKPWAHWGGLKLSAADGDVRNLYDLPSSFTPFAATRDHLFGFQDYRLATVARTDPQDERVTPSVAEENCKHVLRVALSGAIGTCERDGEIFSIDLLTGQRLASIDPLHGVSAWTAVADDGTLAQIGEPSGRLIVSPHGRFNFPVGSYTKSAEMFRTRGGAMLLAAIINGAGATARLVIADAANGRILLERPCNPSAYKLLPAPETDMLAIDTGRSLDVLDLSQPSIPVVASMGVGDEYFIHAASWDKSGSWLIIFGGTANGSLFHISRTRPP